MMKKQVQIEQEKPVCPKCGRKKVYFRMNGSLRCIACGYDSDRMVE